MKELRYPDVAGEPVDDMTHAEARLVVIRQVGLNLSPWSHFGKSDLNSIYRYFTGEFYFPRDKYYTSESPPSGEIRQAIAHAVDLSYDPGPEWNRPFNLECVRKLATEVRERDDQRPYPLHDVECPECGELPEEPLPDVAGNDTTLYRCSNEHVFSEEQA